jgi:hypothetical protein
MQKTLSEAITLSFINIRKKVTILLYRYCCPPRGNHAKKFKIDPAKQRSTTTIDPVRGSRRQTKDQRSHIVDDVIFIDAEDKNKTTTKILT